MNTSTLGGDPNKAREHLSRYNNLHRCTRRFSDAYLALRGKKMFAVFFDYITSTVLSYALRNSEGCLIH
ncbi:MAG: hypothetical protein QW211_04925 [Desulfurococcaceae archaeon]